jgi:protein involved in polysaccharide export with SLBB domain
MASTYSPLLRVELIGTGDQSGTWGITTNANMGTVLEDAIAATATLNVTAGNVTLTTVDGGADQSRCMILKVTGTPGTSRNIIAPALSKVYMVINGSDAAVVLKTSASTGVTIAPSANIVAAYNGSDFVAIAEALPNNVVTLDGVQTLTNKTLTSPKVGTAILDTNGAELIKVNPAASAVNEITIANAATSNAPSLTATGDDTNINISLVPKGTGIVSTSATFNDLYGKVRAIPRSGAAKTGSYTLGLADVGLMIEVQSGGTIIIPDTVFSAGDAISIFNNTSTSVTVTCNITTAYIAGTDSDKASVSLATRGVATVLFISGTVCVISGNVS